MILIFGGAFQGKLDYAMEHFKIDTVWDCGTGEAGWQTGEETAGRAPDFSKDAIYAVEKFVLQCVREGKEAADFFKKNWEKWEEKVIIVTDVSQGIVPINETQRAFREMNGRLMLYLAGEAEQVIRVFCGIGKKVK